MVLDDASLATLFHEGRTHNKWTDQPVTDDELRTLYDLVKMGPTSANTSPARFVFVRTQYGKEKLRPALSALDRPLAQARLLIALEQRRVLSFVHIVIAIELLILCLDLWCAIEALTKICHRALMLSQFSPQSGDIDVYFVEFELHALIDGIVAGAARGDRTGIAAP